MPDLIEIRPVVSNVQHIPMTQWGEKYYTVEAVSLWVKRTGREADHSPPSSAEVKNACLHLHPNTHSWRGA
jgi:hypothetical protein